MRLLVLLVACVAAGLLLSTIRPDSMRTLTPERQYAPLSDAVARGASVPVIACATRAEPGVARFDPKRDVVRGPFALVTIKRELPRLSGASYRPSAGRLPVVKLPVGLRAGHRSTLRVPATQRAHAALLFRQQTRNANRIQDGDRAVTFSPCPPDTPALSGGTVGRITGWAGALMLTGPGCIRLKLRVDGRRRPDLRLPLGRPCK
jgi:hypothetical protein